MNYNDELAHIGVIRKSGRYPWGSGASPHQRSRSFLGMVNDLQKQGLTDKQIIEGLDLRAIGKDGQPGEYYNTTQFRALKSIAVNEKRAGDIAQAQRLKDTGMSTTEIGREMGVNESTIRGYLAPSAKANASRVTATADVLKSEVAEKGYLDIGRGTEQLMAVSKGNLDTSVAVLKEEGYQVMYVKTKQLGTGNDTTVKVLVPPGTEYKTLAQNTDKIGLPGVKSDDMGRSFEGVRPIQNVNSKRVAVRYAEEGGSDMDGVMELRRGVKDLDLGGAQYAQVRIGVDGTHYIKGMAVYNDNLPDGVDIRFNTNKSPTGNKLDALKPQKTIKENGVDTGVIDLDNPFGASIKPGGQRGALNVLQEEGDWSEWSKTLSSQMLSKQTPELAKSQLDLSFKIKKDEFDEINSLTNPEVKRKLLDSFADDADASAVHLKAAGLPRTANHVLLPITAMKDTEIYAPNYKDGEKVVLIRHPHGGKFEIPELTVNNKSAAAKAIMANATDAVGINSKVAAQLSGADFDGDTVLVIPNPPKGPNRIVNQSPLRDLEGFDPQSAYPKFEGMKAMGTPGGGDTQLMMGSVSNLITDMTIKGATDSEIAKAVKHSMVVIDAEKHKLNWRQSEIDNGIKDLKKKYQSKEDSSGQGASTIVSMAKGEVRVPHRKPRPAALGGNVDPATGKKMWVETGETYNRVTKDPKTGEVVSITPIPKQTISTKMAEATDARSLSSGRRIENVYADHANRMKALANDARKESLATKPTPYSRDARKAYEPEYQALRHKLNEAKANAPLERRAQLLANAEVKQKRQADPNMDKDSIKKIESKALLKARERTGASKKRVDFTDKEWEAVQNGAISPSFLRDLLANSDTDKVKQLATPRSKLTVTPAKLTRAKQMMARGFTQAEVAEAMGLAPSTLNDAIRNG